MRRVFLLILLAIAVLALLTSCMTQTSSPSYFTVTFDLGDEQTFTVKTNGNQIIRMPDTPQKDGYVFEGWYYDTSWTKEFKKDSLAYEPLTEDITVYAKWSPAEPSTDGYYVGRAANSRILAVASALAMPTGFSVDVSMSDGRGYKVYYEKASDGFKLRYAFPDSNEYFAPAGNGKYLHIFTTAHGGSYEYVYEVAVMAHLELLNPKLLLYTSTAEMSNNTERNSALIEMFYGEGFADSYVNSIRSEGTTSQIRLVCPVFSEGAPISYNEIQATVTGAAVNRITVRTDYDARTAYTEVYPYAEERTYTYGNIIVDVPSVSGMQYTGGETHDYAIVTYGLDRYSDLLETLYKVYAANSDFVLPTPEIPNRIFDGWYDAGGSTWFGSDGEEMQIGAEDLVLEGKFIEVLPRFVLNGGLFVEEPYDVILFNQLNELIPVKAGYSFGGWYTDAALTDSVEDNGAVYTAQDTVYCKWTPCLKIDVISNNGKFMPPLYGEEGDSFEYALGTPVKEGTLFDGWYTDPEFHSPLEDMHFAAGLNAIYAKYVAGYTITFGVESEDYTLVTPVAGDFEELLYLLTSSVETLLSTGEYELRGWYWDSEFTQAFENYPEDDVRVYPQVALKRYLTLVEGVGKVIDLENVLDLETVSLYSLHANFSDFYGDLGEYLMNALNHSIQAPSLKVITGWYLDTDCTLSIIGWPTDQNINVYPKYEIDETVDTQVYFTFDTGIARFHPIVSAWLDTRIELEPIENVLPDVLDYLELFILCPEDNIFDGWYTDAACTIAFDPNAALPETSFILYAKIIPEIG